MKRFFKKIVIATPVFHPIPGGVSVCAEMLADEFSCVGNKVTIVTLAGPLRQLPLKDRQAVKKQSATIIYTKNVVQYLKAIWQADCVIALQPSIQLSLLPALIKGKMLFAHHNWYPTKDSNSIISIVAAIVRLLMISLHKNIACSHAVAKSVPRSCTVVRNGFRRDIFFSSRGGHKSIDLIFVGRTSKEKGIDLFIDIIATLEHRGLEISAVIIGPTDPNYDVMSEIQIRGSRRISYLGSLAIEEVAGFVRNSIVQIVPSQCEAFGLVALEAMACETVVVGSSAGGLPEAIGGGGIVVNGRDKEVWADVVEKVLESPQTRTLINENSKAHLVNYCSKQMAEQYYATFGWEL